MANEIRLRQNFLGGLIEDNPLTTAATTLTSTSLNAMVTVGSTQHLPIVLDPDGVFGDPEIAWVTSHTVGLSTATILRGQEGSTARQHNQDVPWVHGPTSLDYLVQTPLVKTATYAMATGDFVVFASGSFTVTLPTLPLAGVRYTIKNTGSGSITVGQSNGTIDGAATFVLTNQYDSIDVVWNLTNWSVV